MTNSAIVQRAGRTLLQLGILVLMTASAHAAPFAYIPNVLDQNVSPSNKVVVIDTATNTVVATVTVGVGPRAVVVNPAGTRVYVGDGNGISVINTASNTVVNTFAGIFVNYMTINADGSLLYATSSSASDRVIVVDTGNGMVINSASMGQFSLSDLALNPAGTRLYVANHTDVTVVDATSLAIIGNIPVPGYGTQTSGYNARDVRVNAAGTRVYVTHLAADPILNTYGGYLSAIDTASNTVVATIPTGSFSNGLAIHPADTRIYVASMNDNTVWIIDAATNSLIRSVTMPAPSSVGVDSTGTRVYVTNYVTNGTVTVLDTACNTAQAVVPVGSYPIAWGAPFIGYGGPVIAPPGGGGSPSNLEITGIEITQGSQDLANSVALVSGRRTFVRVYVKSIGPAVGGVTAILKGSGSYDAPGGSVTVPFTPLTPSNANGPRITVVPAPRRANLDESFQFELPWEWTHFKGLRVEAVLIETSEPPPQGCPNDDIAGPVHEFNIPTNLKVAFVRLQYSTPARPPNAGLSAQATIAEQRQSESAIRRSYPLWELRSAPDYPLFDSGLGARVDRSAFECLLMPPDEQSLCAWYYITKRLAALQLFTGFMGNADAAYGLIPQVPDPTGKGLTFTRGACCNSRIGAGSASASSTTAHEMAHFLGRDHPVEGADECGHSATDPNYPYYRTFIGPGILGPTPSFTPETDVAGFDGGDKSLSIPEAYFYGQNAYDLMGYCGPRWISDYTYKALYTALLALHSDIGSGSPGTGIGVSAGRPGPVTPLTGDWLMVLGSIESNPAATAIVQTRRVSQVASIPVRTPGDHSIRLLGAGGVVLADYPFVPESIEDAGGIGAESSGFGHVVPYVAGTQAIEIVDNSAASVVIGSTAVSPNPPTIGSVALQGVPNPVTGTVTLNWAASDADGDALEYDVFLRRDGGNGDESLQPLMLGLTTPTADIDTARFGGGDAQFRVVTTDGVHSAFADTAIFTLDDKPPVPRIASPGVTTTIYRGQSLNFEAEVTDPQLQDGDTPSITIEWSIPGALLGTEGQISINDLPLGDNVVTLTATSSLGLTGSTSVTVTVLDPDPLPGPTLTAGPGSIGWQVAVGEVALQTATLDIGNSGSGNLQFMAESNAAWLSVNVASGMAPATLTLTADPAGFAAGVTAAAEVTLTAVGSPGQIITVPVSLAVGNTFQYPIPEVTPAQNAPVIVTGTGTYAVNENVATGTTITSIVATDADSDPLSYAITAGNAANRFAISSTGVITVAAALDFETQTSYALTVSVSDGINAPVTGLVSINVLDINEVPPPPPTPPPHRGGGSTSPVDLLFLLAVWLAGAITRRGRERATP